MDKKIEAQGNEALTKNGVGTQVFTFWSSEVKCKSIFIASFLTPEAESLPYTEMLVSEELPHVHVLFLICPSALSPFFLLFSFVTQILWQK